MAGTKINTQNNTKTHRTPRRNRYSGKKLFFVCFSFYYFIFVVQPILNVWFSGRDTNLFTMKRLIKIKFYTKCCLYLRLSMSVIDFERQFLSNATHCMQTIATAI